MDDHEKCHDEFLFVDIEWNQKYGTYDIENREAIWIGMVAADENLECKKLFSKTITLEDIDSLTEETCKLVHIGRTNIMNAKSAKEICGKIRQSFPTYRYVVVWSLESYQLFRRTMKKAGVHMCRHKVVVLQEIIRNIAVKGNQCVEFEDALIHATIPYKKDYLHCPKHDVKYLHALFRKLYFAYMNLTSSEMNAVNVKSKTIHTMKCRHGYSENSEVESGAKRLLFYGYRPCKCCWSEDEWRKFSWEPTLSKDTSESKVEEAKTKVQEKCPSNSNRSARKLKELPLTDENIVLICEAFQMKCNLCDNLVFIATGIGYWRVYLDEDEVKEVYHANHWVRRSEYFKKKKVNEGFHKQEVNKKNFFDVVKYIYYHDKNLYKKHHKSRMECLFEKIEKELNGGF